MFVSIAGVAQHVGESAGQVLLLTGAAYPSTKEEIQDLCTRMCERVTRLVCGGSPLMHQAEKEFRDAFENYNPRNL